MWSNFGNKKVSERTSLVSQLNCDLLSVLSNFQIAKDFVSATPHTTGHIHETFVAQFSQGKEQNRYILQRINHHVFSNPPAVMRNIVRVTEHIREKLCSSGKSQISRLVLGVIPALNGKPLYRDDQGNYWRVYTFVENAVTHDIVNSNKLAVEVAKTFGVFQSLLIDLPPPRLTETIPAFHQISERLTSLEHAVEEDVYNRANEVTKEISFIQRHSCIAKRLLQLQKTGQLPERIIHNDTKVNNVMIDNQTGEGICVIDLDTVMPGLVLYDFGDLVRTTASPTAEDERDLSLIEIRMDIFQSLVRGYLDATSSFLKKTEQDCLAFSGQLMSLELGIRFLEDHLSDDIYFRVNRPGQNLDRCRAQLKIFEELRHKEDLMQRVIEKISYR